MLETRYVDNPMLTEGLAAYLEVEKGVSAPRRIQVQGNAKDRIGALCYIRPRPPGATTGNWRDPHQEIAAERFKSLYEARYGVGNGAMDPGRVQVDTSPIAHDSGMAAKIDRTRELYRAEEGLGKQRYDRLVALLVLCVPAGEGLHWKDRKDAITEVLLDLDSLAAVWGYMGRVA